MKRLIVVLAAVSSVALPAQAGAGTLDQQQTQVEGELGVSQTNWQGQSFTAGITGMLDQVDLATRRNGVAPRIGLPLIVQIRSARGGFPSLTVLSTTTTLVFNPVFKAFVPIALSTPVPVTSGGHYAIAVGSTVPPGLNLVHPTVGLGINDPYGGGAASFSLNGGTTWLTSQAGTLDLGFKTYVAPLTAADCKNGGWQNFGFSNQGDCLKSLT